MFLMIHQAAFATTCICFTVISEALYYDTVFNGFHVFFKILCGVLKNADLLFRYKADACEQHTA